MTLRQPTERHGGNAGIDEEVTIMVSRAVASVDVWIARAEEVLQEQREKSLSLSSATAWENVTHEWRVSLGSFELGIEDLLDRLCSRPGRWVLIAQDAGRSNRFWQAMAFEDGSLVVAAANNSVHEGTEQLLPGADEKLTGLGWDPPDLPSSPNWRRVEATINPDIAAVADQAIRTLREVFEINGNAQLLLAMFAVSNRGSTPASECVGDAVSILDTATPGRILRPTTGEWAHGYSGLSPGQEVVKAASQKRTGVRERPDPLQSGAENLCEEPHA